MIVFNQVNYGKLKGLSFQIQRGEIVYIFNREEDCLRDLLGLLSGETKPEDGFIRLPYEQPVLQSEMGMVYRENILLEDRTLAENLAFIMEIRGVKKPFREVRLNRVLQNLKLLELKECLPVELTSYQLLKANIAQALVNYPSFLLVEEPALGLDEVNAQALLHLLEELTGLSLTVIVLCSSAGFVERSHQRVIRLDMEKPAGRKKGSYA